MSEGQGGAARPNLRRRPIVETDFGPLIDLLGRGFPERQATYWRTGFARLAAYAPGATPRTYGNLLEADGTVVGVLMLLPMALAADGAVMRCNLSSWYVEPAFRGYAPMLLASVLQNRQMTYVNISAAPHTRPLIEAQGFVRYAQGQMFVVPASARLQLGAKIHRLTGPVEAIRQVLPDHDLLVAHAAFGCLSFVCETTKGPLPFIVRPRRIGHGVVPAAHLVYCRDVADVVACAGAIGRFLLRRGIGCLIIDANGRIPGLVGKYYEGKAPKYVFGPNPPRLGDITYTEVAVFGA